MLALIQFLLITVAFAWVARALLGARELDWSRTLLGAFIGLIFGGVVAAVILAGDLSSPNEIDRGELTALAIPLALIGTMGALVMLEAFFVSKKRRRLTPWGAARSVRRWFGMWVRGFQVSRILARNGLATVVGLRRRGDRPTSTAQLARSVRKSLEEAGGMFVKLGQLLVTRPDLLPPEALAELGKLHAEVAPLPIETVRDIVETETGRTIEQSFSGFDTEPLGSASIGQAHAARLIDGREVVVKVRRPGLDKQVDRDLSILWWLAGVAERRTTWARTYGARNLVAEFSGALRDELHLTTEARHASEVAAAVSRFPGIVVPRIFDDLTTDAMLVMERIGGAPLSHIAQEHPDMRARADDLCRSQVEAMLRGGRFHGDPHPGNVMIVEDGKLGLIDFGITGRLDSFERAAVFEMLVALGLEDPVVLFDGLVTIGAVGPDHDPDQVQRALAHFLAESTASGMPSPRALTDLLRLTTRLGMRMPSSASTMFRALATLAGTLETLSPDYPLLDVVADIGGAELRQKMTPGSVGDYIQQEWAELGPVIKRAPHHLDRIATQLEHGGLTGSIRLFRHEEDIAVVERMLNRVVTAFLSIGLGAVSAFMLTIDRSVESDLRLSFFDILGWSGITMAVILLLRVLLEVFRAEGLYDAGNRLQQ